MGYFIGRGVAMANGMSTLFSGLVGLAGTAGAVTVGAGLLRRTHPYLPGGHVLAGPRDGDPLPVALRHGLAGLTVPVRPGPGGELLVGPLDPRRTLRNLVLGPLFDRARARGGRLRPDQSVPFRLVVQFVGPERDADTLLRAYHRLDGHLREHAPLLSRYMGGLLEPGAVTVSVTGTVDVRGVLAAQRERYVFAEGTFDDLGVRAAPPSLVPMISEPWGRRFGWDGREPIPAEERHLLHHLVSTAHSDGRTVRISAVPPGPRRVRRAVWDELMAAGVDAIADADPPALAEHLRRRSVRPAGPYARRPASSVTETA
jgi:hypothetical protein